MKKLWLVLLSLGLIVAFSASAMAVDVKVAGSYYAAGMYLDKTSFTKSKTGGNPSTAFYFQRLRLGADFVVSPGLNLITRMDIMERAWGAARTSPGTTRDPLSAGTTAENENIAFDWVYLTYVSPIGVFGVGYMNDTAWGTVFGDTSTPNAKITYLTKFGNLSLGAQMGKNSEGENSWTAKRAAAVPALRAASDLDSNFYNLLAKYQTKTIESGILFKYVDDRTRRANAPVNPVNPGSSPQSRWVINALPYVKAQLGPVFVQGEVIYQYGKAKLEEEGKVAGQPDSVDISMFSAWIDATADLGKFYVGGSLAYMSGDDPNTTDKIEGSFSGGADWNPCLIMFNSERNYWAGGLNGYETGVSPQNVTKYGEMANAYFAQFRGGVRPTDKLDIVASVSWAHADKTGLASRWEGRDYGYEIDVTGTYKITNNLSYMLGAGYWIVGNYYKGATSSNNDLNDDFMVINKLSLTF
jgi:hypothetical protein